MSGFWGLACPQEGNLHLYCLNIMEGLKLMQVYKVHETIKLASVLTIMEGLDEQVNASAQSA